MAAITVGGASEELLGKFHKSSVAPGADCINVPFVKQVVQALWTAPAHHKPRNPLIRKLQDGAEYLMAKARKIRDGLQRHVPKEGQQQGRLVRSERRFALISVLKYLIYSMDEQTFRVARRTPKGVLLDYSLEDIAKATGLQYERVKRVMSDLYRKGYVKVERKRVQYHNGQTRAINSIRTVTTKILDDLGIPRSEAAMTKHYKESQSHKKVAQKDNPLLSAVRSIFKPASGAYASTDYDSHRNYPDRQPARRTQQSAARPEEPTARPPLYVAEDIAPLTVEQKVAGRSKCADLLKSLRGAPSG